MYYGTALTPFRVFSKVLRDCGEGGGITTRNGREKKYHMSTCLHENSSQLIARTKPKAAVK